MFITSILQPLWTCFKQISCPSNFFSRVSAVSEDTRVWIWQSNKLQEELIKKKDLRKSRFVLAEGERERGLTKHWANLKKSRKSNSLINIAINLRTAAVKHLYKKSDIWSLGLGQLLELLIQAFYHVLSGSSAPRDFGRQFGDVLCSLTGARRITYSTTAPVDGNQML
ncbi:uncharacterized protein isoform X2 [Rhodnius prolixus]|uniref:uncharacterized protein isoform X2 n=1 Tax=Rhodnius prolixus TaxID=13249 RepID=UPI003D18CE8F